MPRLSLLPTLVREVFTTHRFPREPEPDLVMSGNEQVAAFVEAGRIDGVMAATYLFNSARISQVIQGSSKVIDLGCGPATQLAQIAELHPEISFIGVDLSEEMLARAREHVRALGLNNVEFVADDISRLEAIPDQSVDGVISTLALHHLPTIDHLRSCFTHIRRILRPGGAIYLTDLGRLKSLKSALFFAYMNSAHQPHIFSLDYERSLRAAFVPQDFRGLTAEELPPDTTVHCTFQIPVLIVVKSPDRPLSDDLKRRLKQMRNSLLPRYRRELDDIRLFLWLGGMANGPFR